MRLPNRSLCFRLPVLLLISILFIQPATSTSVNAADQASQLKQKQLRYAAALDGDIAVVGASWQDGYAGSASVLRLSEGRWHMEQMLSAPESKRFDNFGSSVAVAGNYIAVGAPWHNLFRGAVYIFAFDGQKWQLQQTISPPDASPDTQFGTAIDFHEGLLSIGTADTESGTVYRFEDVSGSWIRLQEKISRQVSPGNDQNEAGDTSVELPEALSAYFEDPPLCKTTAADTLEWVTATDGVYEDRVEIKWSPVELDAIIYKILRDGVLISVASSEDSLYNDTSGDRGVTYNYCIITVDMHGGESAPLCDSGSRIIRAPAHLAASDGEFIDGIHLSWEDRSAVEEGFYVKRDGSLIATVVSNARYYIDTEPLPLTVHDYEVSAFDSDGNESLPVLDSGFRGAILPPLQVTASDGEYTDSVRVSWLDQGDETGFIITRLNLSNMDSAIVDTTAMDSDEFFDTTAQPGVRYKYCVFSLAGSGQLSVPVCDEGGIDLITLANVAASDSTFDDRVQVTWEDDSGLADGFYVWRDGAPLDTVGANVRTYNDYDATPDTQHTYCVLSYNSNGGISAPVCDNGLMMIVLAPYNVQASDGNHETRTEITWESKSTTVAVFKLFRDGVFIKSLSSDTRRFDDEGGTAGREYLYGVQAVTGQLSSSEITADNGSRELNPPTGVIATDEEFEDRVEISWNDVSTVESGFVIYRTENGSTIADSIGETGSNTSSFVDRTGKPGTLYKYQITAFDREGEERGESEFSEADEGNRILKQPTSVSATDGEFEDRVEITWADNSNAEDGYRVYRGTDMIGETGDNVTSLIDYAPQLDAVTEYNVYAFDMYGMSEADSDSGSTVVLPPASFNASDIYEDRIELRWVDISEIEQGYILFTDSLDTSLRVDTLGAGSTFFTDTTAAPNVNYTYRLRAFASTALSAEVEDRGMRPVPTVISETTEMTIKIKPGDADYDEQFGVIVSIDGKRAVIGVPHDLDDTGLTGSVYVFSENADDSWSQEAKLFGPGPPVYDTAFGSSVDVSGDRLVAGAPWEGGNVGTVSFYTRDSNGDWTSAGKIWSSNPPGSIENFGAAVAIEGDHAVVGAPYAPDGAEFSGAVYLFQRTGGIWTEKVRFKADVPQQEHWFGQTLDVSGDRIAVGAPWGNRIYIFKINRNETTNAIEGVTQEAELSTLEGNNFGAAVAISGDYVVAGPQQQYYMPGFANVYKRDTTTGIWSLDTQLTASDGTGWYRFGQAVSMNGNRILVGLGGYDSTPGAAYIYERNDEGDWIEKGKLIASDNTSIRKGGVKISSDRLIVGAPYDHGESLNEGAAYIVYLVQHPEEVEATDGTVEGFVHLQWRDRSDNEEGFIIYRDGVRYASVGADVTFYDDIEAEPGRTYEYAVTAYNGTSGFESEQIADYGWRPPDGHITGRVTAQNGTGVEHVSICLEPPPSRALLFDGTGGHVQIPEDGTFNFTANQNFTVEVWFSYSGSNRSPRLVSKLASTQTDERPFDLGLQRSGRLFFVMSDGTDVARVLSQRNDMADDRWHHVACVHDASSRILTLYIDGVNEDSVSTAGLNDITNESDIYIGGFGENTWFGGQLDELRVWGTARTPIELDAASATPLLGNEEGLEGYWPFDAFSGSIVTDFAEDAQYGIFVGGVYRTDDVAPLDICGRTDSDGNFVLTNVRYEENGTEFKVRPSLGDRYFSPAVQKITLNREHPVENQVLFNDISSHTVSGIVKFAGTGCLEPDVEIRIDGQPGTVADKNGKFSLALSNDSHTIRARYRDYDFSVVYEGDTTAIDSITIDVTDDIYNLVFLNETTYPVSGKAGGGCGRYVGEISIRYRSENNCLDTTFAGNPEYSLDLPPMKYFASATIDRETIPESLVESDVIEFFQNLGEREVNLSADTDTTVIDDTLDFIYRTPLRITINGFESYVDPGCPQLELEDGTVLPSGLPVIPQGDYIDLTILVEEVYGDLTCPLDSGIVIITDEIADQENYPDTVQVADGIATYTTYASTPNLVRGRMEGTIDRSFQKALTIKGVIDGRAPVLETEWVLVTGHVAPEGAEFVTVPTTEIPLFVLRDPPGDGSYAFIEKGTTISRRIKWHDWTISGGFGAAWEFKAGATSEAFVGFGAGFIKKLLAHFTTEGKLLIGAKYTNEHTIDVRVTTTERIATSGDENFVGSNADLYVGLGITFLFSEVGVIELDGCVVEQSTSIGFEPDSIHTTYSFTEGHITDILIPELESKVAYYRAQQDEDSVSIFQIMRDQWQYQVDYNRTDKQGRVDTLTNGAVVARGVENRSFSAGAEYDYTSSADTTTVTTHRIGGYVKGEGKFGFLGGLKDNAELFIGLALETDNEWLFWGHHTDSTHAFSVGYHLSDNDAGDNFTVDIVRSNSQWGDIFDVRGGRSSCPYEPWLHLASDEPTMVRRDNPQLFIDPKERYGVPPDEEATFKITIVNLSDEQRDYVIKPVSNSNPGGAIMNLNGAPITDHPVFSINGVGSGVNSHEATLTVARGPSRFNYERLALVVEPVCGGNTFGPRTEINTVDSLFFDVSFEGCSSINMRGPDIEPGWVYNAADSAAERKLEIILDGYELVINPGTPNLLEAVGIQYRSMGDGREGPGPWIDIEEIEPGVIADISNDGSPDTIMTWQPDSLANGAYLPLSDGIYEVRAFTVCSTGSRSYSNVSMGTIDRHPPLVFGTPQPSDGELSLGEDISITFNELIDCSTIEYATISLKYVDGPLAGEYIDLSPGCNGETIIITPQADPVDLDGRRLEAAVGGITDRVGNTMTATVTWQFDYRQSLFTWSQTRITQQVPLTTPGSLPAELVNGTSKPVDFEITDTPLFLTAAPSDAGGRLAPGGARVIEFAIDPLITGGIHEGQVTVQATDTTGADTLAVAVLDVILDVSCAAPDWSLDAGSYEHSMSIVARVSTDDGFLRQGNDLLAAFVGNQLRGLASPKAAAGDTLLFLTVFSNRTDGETVRFEVWDNDRCRRYGSTAERVAFNADDVVGSRLAPAELTALDTPPGTLASFPLVAGWNWFSTNMLSADMSVGSVLSNLTPAEGDIIKSKTAFSVFDPDTSIGWIGTLTMLDNVSMYMINLTEPGTVIQEGSFIDPLATSVPVDNGWNWIGYTPKESNSVTEAMADIEGQNLLNGGEIIKSHTTFAEWNSGWYGSLESMQPGMGYRLYLQDPSLPATFTYPGNTTAANTAIAGSAPVDLIHFDSEPGWDFNPALYEYNMNLIAVVTRDGMELKGSHYLLGAFAGGECRGTVPLMNVSGLERSLAFMTIHGNESADETISFRIFNTSTDAVYTITGSEQFKADNTVGSLHDPVILTASSRAEGEVPAAYRLVQNHPNPFNPTTTIQFDLPQPGHVVLTIYNVAGQLVQKLTDRNYPAGSFNVTWDGKTVNGVDASSGVYFYRIKADEFVAIKKMVLLR